VARPERRGLLAGLARSNLEDYMAARKDAADNCWATAVRSAEHSDLFRTTETYRAGGEGKEKTDRPAGCGFMVLLKDLLAAGFQNAPELVRNHRYRPRN